MENWRVMLISAFNYVIVEVVAEIGKRKEKKRLIRKVATMSLPAVDRPNDDCWNAARSCQKC